MNIKHVNEIIQGLRAKRNRINRAIIALEEILEYDLHESE